MFNIFPDNLKKNIQSEYSGRLVVLSLAAVFFVEVSFIIFLLPTYVSLHYQEKFLDSEITPAVQSTQPSSMLAAANSEIFVLSHHMPPSMHGVISELAAVSGSGITLSDISYQAQVGTTSTITLQGKASTRQSLLSFTQTLQADPHFSNVNLPVSSFAKDTNISFSLSLATTP